MSAAWAQSGGELRFCVRSEPKTFNPLLVADDASETVRYLTGGVLMRLNRLTQTLEPELATTWQVSKDGRTITFTLRDKVYFSDGTPFSAEDVAFTVKQMMDPNLHSPTGDAFRSGTGEVAIKVLAPTKLSITFPAAVAGLDRLCDQVAIMSAKSAKKEMAVLGPFYIADYKSGSYILLKRNPNYWKHDSAGHTLPYLGSVK
ncbi:MAG TPA: ABC transporter substrate-binding protein, partial [Terriglobales bacterium]|nr:ABC transporter substrate-binding protein [Terriglobales bacterium]